MTRRNFIALSAGASLVPFLGSLEASEAPLRVDVAPREPACVAVDFEALLWAIAMRETGNRDDVVGPKGERSRFQITETVWKQHRSFKYQGSWWCDLHAADCHGDNARWTAEKHLRWLDANIPRRTLTERYQREHALAFAWRAGLTGWLRYTSNRAGMTHAAAQGVVYASDVANLYQDRLRPLSPQPAPCSPSPHFKLSPTLAH